MTMDTRILHARSGVTLEQKDDVYRVSSLRLSDPATFSEEADAQRAFDDEVASSEQNPELMSRLGGA